MSNEVRYDQTPLASASAFAVGQEFPPERERARHALFNQWSDWSHRRWHGLVPELQDASGQLRFNISGYRQVTRLSPNMFRFLMQFWSQAIVTSGPAFDYDGNDRANAFIARLRPALMQATDTVVADMIRYGVGIFRNRNAEHVEALDPRWWFPLYDFVTGTETGYVLAQPFVEGDQLMFNRLAVTSEGVLRVHELDGLTIGPVVSTTAVPNPDGAVVPVRSGPGFYGTSDFEDTAEYVAELFRRESSISEALDRQADPHLAVPEGAIQVDAQGRAVVSQDGMVIFVPADAAAPAYVTWDAKFDAQEMAIKRAEARILRMSKIAPVLATPGEFGISSIASGAALRRLAVMTVNRLKELREALTTAYKQVIPAQAQLLGAAGGERIAIDGNKISVTWPPELGTGFTDEADAIAALLNSGALTKETALQLVEGLSKKEAEEKVNEQQQQAAERFDGFAGAPDGDSAQEQRREGGDTSGESAD